MSMTLTLTSGGGPATIASSDPGAASLFGAVTKGWPVSSASRAARLRCLIVDDSPRFLDAARGLLRQGIRVVGVASTSAEALQQATVLPPDIALLDINLGGESGFDLARRLSREVSLACTRMVLISTHAEQDYTDLIAASPVLGSCPSRPYWPTSAPWSQATAMATRSIRSAGVQEGDHRQDATVIVVGLREPRLGQMLRTGFSTVPSVTHSRRPMPASERPSAISASTSRSRVLSTASGSLRRRADTRSCTSAGSAIGNSRDLLRGVPDLAAGCPAGDSACGTRKSYGARPGLFG